MGLMLEMSTIAKQIEEQMLSAARDLDFERAAKLRDQLLEMRGEAPQKNEVQKKVVEDLDVAVVCRVIFGDELAESEIVIVLVGEFEDRFLCLLAEPYYGAANELVSPLAVGYLPRVIDTSQFVGSLQVEYAFSA